ncbi:hypothetical protein COOONC_06711 [Cooperia oncophora]
MELFPLLREQMRTTESPLGGRLFEYRRTQVSCDANTRLSLGIGKDVEAEKSMKTAMPNCEFWGADPVNDTNADIFPEVGKFYNIAVGAENGTFRSYVLEGEFTG